ncbi:MAG: hypothetical protein DRJ26_05400 [Candidatus Methanomethylicota archaeon]|uniref:DUF4352 domain-containing protein n=1 Tax=Thermoproteota archaeon TaxID=2056631 RepID=A0A497EWP0_9CREN|nr:MAG: hypothetical protein DRJ26_05400 [Candidatus Verstraetearchaeota archaeon]
MRIMRSRRGISAIIVSLIILAVSLGMAAAYAAMMMGWFGGASAVVKVDTSDSKVILHPSTGYAKFQLVIRNLGTITMKISSITIDLKSGKGVITFTSPMKFNLEVGDTQVISGGSIYGSSTAVVVTSDGKLIIPPGQSATLFGEVADGKPYWDVNENYRGTIFYEGGAIDFKYPVETY